MGGPRVSVATVAGGQPRVQALDRREARFLMGSRALCSFFESHDECFNKICETIVFI